MKKILSVEEAQNIASRLRKQGKKIVLAGGCFDILHIGHLRFLEKAKEQGDVLMLFLESDEAIRKRKGNNRPINNQEDRARLLSALSCIDYVVLLSGILSDADYDRLTTAIKPAIIATTKLDPARLHKERQAKFLGIKVVDVTDYISTKSTSRIAQILKKSW
jgi:rfaE bifunctional protein nucleotidyltransferase chain/domain